jgi:ubiquinone/menaquinone biosynthesis C-methylase UbiE
MPTIPPKNENTYFIDIESGAEMARLMNQDRFLTTIMGGVLSEQADLSHVQDILDIACGPGGWVLDVAYAYPQINVVGIDISQGMIEYARAQANVQLLDNASFINMDALKPLQFLDHSFDLVNTRLICPFMLTTAWPSLLQECMRITRPGGIARLTEWNEPGITNSPACEELQRKCFRALQLAGRTFAPDGRHFGINQMLGRFLREAGYQNIQHKSYVIDFSSGTAAYETWFQNLRVGFTLLLPFLLNYDVTTKEEFEELYQQFLIEIMSDSFCGICFLLTVWGEKPA